jgi:hypothetical protein
MKKKKTLTLYFMPYSEIEGLSSLGRIKKLLRIAKEDKIVLLEGRLKKEEEVELIKTTMEEIDEEFKGIELAVINPSAGTDEFIKRMQANLINLIGGNRLGLTIIGPSSIVKEIKKDPSKIQLFFENEKNRKKRR